MKDSKVYSQKIQKCYRAMKKAHPKVTKITHEDPVEAMVAAALTEHLTDSQVSSSLKKIKDYFIDYNDLRVSKPEEIAEVIDAEGKPAVAVAQQLIGALRSVFIRYHSITLDALKKLGKRPAKQQLEKLEGTTPFIVDYMMLTCFGGHSIPLSKEMIDYLKSQELVHPDADLSDIEGFLTRQITAKNGYEFYGLLRRESHTPKVKTKIKTRTKKTRKKKTAVKKKKK